jgi:hypothetical protein
LPPFAGQPDVPTIPEAGGSNFLVQHLNDPNYDLKKSSEVSSAPDIDTEPGSNVKNSSSTEGDSDEWAIYIVLHFPC